MEIEKVLVEIENWVEIEGVEAVGRGEENGEDVILLVVSKPLDELKEDLPLDSHKNYKIKLVTSGKFSARKEKK